MLPKVYTNLKWISTVFTTLSCFLMCITWKGFGQLRKTATTFYTTCLSGHNSTPRLANTLCIKRADPASTCINLIPSALSHSANTLCLLSKVKQHPTREKNKFYESEEAGFTPDLQRVRVCEGLESLLETLTGGAFQTYRQENKQTNKSSAGSGGGVTFKGKCQT